MEIDVICVAYNSNDARLKNEIPRLEKTVDSDDDEGVRNKRSYLKYASFRSALSLSNSSVADVNSFSVISFCLGSDVPSLQWLLPSAVGPRLPNLRRAPA